MRIVIAPDSFKGSLSAAEACMAIACGVARVVPDAETICVPMADGGEGTVDALVAATEGEIRRLTVCGPLGEQVEAAYGILGPTCEQAESSGRTAVIEIAAAAGLPLVPVEMRNPLYTTTYGVGELILDALEQQCRNFIVGIGGSATNDCGTALAQALGVRFLDKEGNEIKEPMTGELMGRVGSLDTTGFAPGLAESTFTVACDVDNPLLGPRGATYVYGPQKGADGDAKVLLEANMEHIIGLIEDHLGKEVRDAAGAGAAGGLGAGLMAFLGARLEGGIGIVLRQCRLAEKLKGADLVISGEGRIDDQTANGKTICGIAALAVKEGVPLIALGGSVGADTSRVLKLPVAALVPICRGPVSLEQAMKDAATLLADATEQALRLAVLDLARPTP